MLLVISLALTFSFLIFLFRYFTKQELRELFQLGDTRSSTTQQQLEELHGLDRRRDPELDTHIAFLYSLGTAAFHFSIHILKFYFVFLYLHHKILFCIPVFTS